MWVVEIYALEWQDDGFFPNKLEEPNLELTWVLVELKTPKVLT